MKKRMRLGAALILCMVFTAGVMVHADDNGEIDAAQKEQALGHFQKGQARFEQQEYLLAVEHFKIAYELTQSPEILYNIARCYEMQHENEQAVAHYKMYLEDTKGQVEDAAAVEKTILALGGTLDETADDDEGDAAGKDDGDNEGASYSTSGEGSKKGRLDRVTLALALGPAFVIVTPDTGNSAQGVDESVKRNYFSIDILLHFFLNDWFAITGVMIIGPYIEGDTPYIARDPKRHFGAGAGVGMKKQLKGRASLFTNILAIPCAIRRENITKRATWIAFDFRLGLDIQLSRKTQLTIAAVAEGGPAFVVNPSGATEWETGLLVSVGPRLGLSYTF